MKKFALLSIVLSVVCAGRLRAADPEAIVKGLNNPCGVAIQPETGAIFVSESGAGRIVHRRRQSCSGNRRFPGQHLRQRPRL